MALHAPAILVIIASLVISSHAQSAPTSCTYDDGVFECDYSQMTSVSDRPIDFSQFSPVPQRIDLLVAGFLPYFGKLIFLPVNNPFGTHP